jgi:hypothetical protein
MSTFHLAYKARNFDSAVHLSALQRNDVVIIRVARVVIRMTRNKPLVHEHGKRYGEATPRHVPANKCHTFAPVRSRKRART